jgi:hypothetical protein
VRDDLTFEFAGLEAGHYSLYLRNHRGEEQSIRFEVGEADVGGVEFQARSGSGEIRGQVRGLERGFVSLVAVPGGDVGARPASHRFAFAEGRFEKTGLAAGRSRVFINAAGAEQMEVAGVDVAGAVVTVDVDPFR